MSRVVLFHHALGRTDGVIAFAERLRESGHVVETPDLFEGRRFSTIDEGVAHASDVGFATIIERGAAAVPVIDEPVVFAGMSLGVLPAQMLAQTRSNAVGALLLHACVPATEFGSSWPAAVALQVHAMEADPFFVDDGDLDAARAIVERTRDAELFLYPGDVHLFTDSSLDVHDAAATDLVVERAASLLTR